MLPDRRSSEAGNEAENLQQSSLFAAANSLNPSRREAVSLTSESRDSSVSVGAPW